MNEPLSKLGKYQIQGALGRGAMGVVYRGFDPVIERPVAIKTMRRLHDADDEIAREAEERFVREAKAAGRLNHPNIVGVYDFGDDGDTAFIVMELVDGKVLKDALESRQPMPVAEAVRIMVKVLAALEYSHSMEVVHRDVKPGNIILTSSGEVKLMDFGIAKLESSTMTQAGAIMGTPSYMSPEQFTGAAVDARSDIFSAGAVLYEMLTGQKAFSGSFATVMHQVVSQDFPPPGSGPAHLPPNLDRVVRKAMAKKAEDRYQSAAQFSQEIVAATQGAQESPPPGGGDGTVVMSNPFAPSAMKDDWGLAPPAASGPPPTPPSAATAGRGKLVGVGAAVAIIAAVGAGWWLMQPPASLQTTPATRPAETAGITPPAPQPSAPQAPISVPTPVPAPAPPPAVAQAVPQEVPSAQPASITVRTDKGNSPRYRVGEDVKLSVVTSADAHVYCFYQQATGEVFRVFPNASHPNSSVKGGDTLRIPGKAPFRIRVDVPNSVEGFGCVASQRGLEALYPVITSGPDLTPLPYRGLQGVIGSLKSDLGDTASISQIEIMVQ